MGDKVGSIEELKALRDKARAEIDVRSGPKALRVNVHMGTCGIAAGARDIVTELADELHAAGVRDVTLTQSGCAGLCSHEPMLTLTDQSGAEFRYGKLDRAKVKAIVRDHLIGGHPIPEYLITLRA